MSATPHKTMACLFDFDGTLVDSMTTLTSLAGRVLRDTHGVEEAEGQRLYRMTSGLPFCQQVELLFPHHPWNQEAIAIFEREKKLRYFEHSFFADAADTIRYLRLKGIKVVVSSSNQQDIVEEYLARTGIEFDLVLGYRENFTKGKCHFDMVCQRFGIALQSMLFVGDSLTDAEQALTEQVSFIGKAGLYSRGEFRERYPHLKVIETLAELKDIM